MKVGDLVQIIPDDTIGVVIKTHVPLQPNMVEILINGNEAVHIQPYFLKVINESR